MGLRLLRENVSLEKDLDKCLTLSLCALLLFSFSNKFDDGDHSQKQNKISQKQNKIKQIDDGDGMKERVDNINSFFLLGSTLC